MSLSKGLEPAGTVPFWLAKPTGTAIVQSCSDQLTDQAKLLTLGTLRLEETV